MARPAWLQDLLDQIGGYKSVPHTYAYRHSLLGIQAISDFNPDLQRHEAQNPFGAPWAYFSDGFIGNLRMRMWDIGITSMVLVLLVLYFFLLSYMLYSSALKNLHMKFLLEKTKYGSPKYELMSYLSLSGIMVTMSAGLGVFGWINHCQDLDPEERLYMRRPFMGGASIASLMLAYQTWNIWMCWRIKDYRNVANIGHHVVTASLAFFAHYYYGLYYVCFFTGLAEISNIPLTFYDMIKYAGLKTKCAKFYQISGILFAITFLPIRVIWWPFVSYDFWMRNLYLVRKNTYHSGITIFAFLAGNIFITFLQFYWGSAIIKMLISKVKALMVKKPAQTASDAAAVKTENTKKEPANAESKKKK